MEIVCTREQIEISDNVPKDECNPLPCNFSARTAVP